MTCSSASASASFSTAGVGTAKTVTGTGFTLAGADSANYTITLINTTTANIAKADPVCTITGYSVPYDGSPHTATGSCLGVVGETLAGLDLSGTTHTAAGNYPADPWTFTDVTGNYTDDSGTVADRSARPPRRSASGPWAPRRTGPRRSRSRPPRPATCR